MSINSQNYYISVFKTHKGIRSDYKLSQHWQVEPSRISQYRKDRLRLPLVFILEIADTIGAEPLELIVALEYKRAREQDKETLKDVYFREALKTIGARMSRDCRGSGYRGRG